MSLRIVIVGLHYAPELSGNAPYTTALARALSQRGHDVQVVTGLPHYPAWRVPRGFRRWSACSNEDGVDVRRLGHYVPRRPSLLRRALMEITFGIRAVVSVRGVDTPEVLLCVSPALLSSALILAPRRKASRPLATCLWVQDVYAAGLAELHGDHAAGSLLGRVEGTSMRAADGIVVAHERFRDRVVDRYGVAPECVQVIRNWTHLGVGRVDSAAIRQRLGWGDDVVVLHAGNMGAKQGLDSVVEAARLADKRRSPVRFVLMGGGNQEQRLRDFGNGVERLDFCEPLDDESFPSALAAADVLLVNEAPGVSEMSVPSKLTSYYSAGRPVLAATAAGSVTAQEIELSGAGVRVAPGDAGALLDGVLDLMADQARADALGASGKRFMHEHLTEQAAVDRFEDWLERLSRRSSA